MSASSGTLRLRRFRARTAALITVLAVLVGALAAANVLQPPRLVAVDTRPVALTEQDGARVVLRLSQAVAAVGAESVRSDPALPVELTSAGSGLTLTLGARLDYGSTLRIAVDVRSAATGAASTVEAVVRAPDTRVVTLVRDARGDRLLSTGVVADGAVAELTPAPRIQEFAVLPDRVLVIAETGSGRAALRVGQLAGGEASDVITDGPIVLEQLRAEPAVLAAGVVASGTPLGAAHADRTLLLFDASGDFAAPVVVTGADGASLRVDEWRFIPGTSAVVVRAMGGGLWLADPLLGGAAVALAPGAAEAALLRDPAAGVVIGDAEVAPSVDGGTLVRTRDGAAEPIFTPAAPGSRIGAVCAAPNGRVLSVEVIAAGAESDGRAVRPGWTRTTTVLLRADTGEQIRSVIGASPSWC